MSLPLIKVVDGIAVIDSRRYCTEVIEVHHGDWLQNVVKDNKDAVERRFGTLRFENGGVQRKDGVINTAEKYLLLTEDQTNAFLVLSRNSTKVKEKKLDLIAEFSEAKNFIKSQLERSFAAEAASETLSVFDTPGYTHTLHSLWIDSGIVKKSQVRDAVTLYFIKGKDYNGEGLELQLTESCYTILMLSFRSKKGIDKSKLPSLLKINTEELYQYEQRKKANTRNPKARYANPGQMELFTS